MELKLDDVSNFISLVKQVDIYSFLLYFSFLLPFFYVLLCKMLGVDETPAQPPPPPADTTKRSLGEKIIAVPVEAINSVLNFFTVKNAPGRKVIFFISSLCFVAGIAVLVLHGRTVTRIQRQALQVRNFMIAHHFSECELSAVLPVYGVDEEDLLEVFPRDFVIDYPYNFYTHEYFRSGKNDTAITKIMLVDSVQLCRSIEFATKMIDSYLNHKLGIGDSIYIDDLLKVNSEFFTRQYTYELIAKKPFKYFLGGDANGIPTITLLKKETFDTIASSVKTNVSPKVPVSGP